MKQASRTLTQFVVIGAMLILSACGSGNATPTSEAVAATATSEPATATPEASTATPETAATPEAGGAGAVSETVASTVTSAMTSTVISSASSEVTATAPISESGAISTSGATFTDPFAYCEAVGTINAPHARFSGPAVPDSVANGLQSAMKTDMPLEVLANGTSWRCMESKVYACFVGANLPCTEQANVDKTPTQAEVEFCQQSGNADADTIPAVVTGHNTVYSWRCTAGKPEIINQVFQVDAQGFVADIWYPISSAAATEVVSPTVSSAVTTTK